ncbi:hypothetical protein AB0C51_19315 [Streptomyces pathocidini]|uniref:Uncharacterized protein n=1 Tax=Streptomyces pathocidini TaxID=1650571 RepID=A0ABW7ULR5_9ACTN|nr:hypothetical protein [Streptomyces pathocidini]
MMTGHWLLRRSQTAADRTWTDVGDAMTWLKTTYESNPPFKRDDGKQAYAALDTKIVYAMDVLPRGVDVTWAHYTESSSLTSFTVVCCPNQFHPEIACPMPPN